MRTGKQLECDSVKSLENKNLHFAVSGCGTERKRTTLLDITFTL